MGPELLWPEEFGFSNCQQTKESDCYALGMVILEVLSGQIPFVGDRDLVAMLKVTRGERPKRPEQAWFTNNVWGILESCWALKPQDRPRLEAVLESLEETSPSWTTFFHPIPSAAESCKRELSDQDGTLTVEVS